MIVGRRFGIGWIAGMVDWLGASEFIDIGELGGLGGTRLAVIFSKGPGLLTIARLN